jgi:hypothetical protein
MEKFKVVVLLTFFTTCMTVNAQSRVEKLGLAVSAYYGASVMLKIISEGNCKKYIKININEFNLSLLRANINRILLPAISKSDYDYLQEMYITSERDLRSNNKVFLTVPENKCQELSDEFIKIHSAHKATWNNLTN